MEGKCNPGGQKGEPKPGGSAGAQASITAGDNAN